MSGLIWIQTVCHSASIPERNFRTNFENNQQTTKPRFDRLPSMQSVKAYELAKTSNIIPAPNEHSDSPGHPPSQVRIFTLRSI